MRILLTLLLFVGCDTDRRTAGGGGVGGGGPGLGAGGEEGEGEGEGDAAGGQGGGVAGGDGRGEGGLGEAGQAEGGQAEGGQAAGGEGLEDEWPEICKDLPEGQEQPELDLDPKCRQGNAPLRIRDVRDPRCDDHEELPTRFPGREVIFDEAIVTGVFGNDFTVRDPEGGAYSALWVYAAGRAEAPVQAGDRVRLEGTVIEFYTLTEMSVAGGGALEILGSGNAPTPIYVADPARISDGGDLVEQLESQIVEIRDVEVTNTAPDCPLEFHMFEVTRGLRIGNYDPPIFGYEAARGDVLTKIVGAVYFGFDHNKLLPRGDADLATVRCGGVPDKCDAMECPVPEDAFETGKLILTEIQDNPEGEDALREYVEIYNPGPGAVDLTGWSVRDCAERGVPLQGRLAAGRHHVIVKSMDSEQNGGVDADGVMGDLFLPNGFGEVLLYDELGELADQVRYRVGDPWPRRRNGQSLELSDPAADNRDGATWRAGSERYGDGGQGSPGAPAQRGR